MPIILSWLTGAVGRYLLMGVLGFVALAVIRHNLIAPYRSEIVALRQAAADKDAIIEKDAAEKAKVEAELAQSDQRLRDGIEKSNAAGACKLTADELLRLRKL